MAKKGKTTIDLTLFAMDPWQCYFIFHAYTAKKGKTTIDLTLSAVDPRQKGKDYH